jgi:hypothetical protein
MLHSQDLTPHERLALEALAEHFDQRLANLKAPGSGERLRSVLTEPARLDGQVIAGQTEPDQVGLRSL